MLSTKCIHTVMLAPILTLTLFTIQVTHLLDIKDVATRLLSHLQGTVRNHLDKLPGPRILAAGDLTPSETAMLDREHVLGIATESPTR